MLIYILNLRYNWGNYVLLKNGQHFKRHKYKTLENRQYGAKLLEDMRKLIKVDRRRRIYVYKTNKKSIDKLKKKKQTKSCRIKKE